MRPGNTWGTRIGFYLIAVGSAVGLGNLWRFPFVIADNGGGAFFLMLVFLGFVVGMPLIVGELLLGKATGKGIVASIITLGRASESSESRAMKAVMFLAGRAAMVLCLVILAYYAVISGWVIHFVIQYLVSMFQEGQFNPREALELISQSPWLQVLLTGIHLLIVSAVIAYRGEERMERWVGYTMPLFVVLIFFLMIQSMSLPSATAAMQFLLYPDFSTLTYSSLGSALGQVFFTLSAGFGTMVTMGSLIRAKTYVPALGFRITLLDSAISVFAGLLIFPVVVLVGIDEFGPDLLFKTVPVMLSVNKWESLFGFGFFLCLYLASLAASVGLLQTVVLNLEAFKPKVSHVKSTLTVGAVCFLVALAPALSSSYLSDVFSSGRGFLEVFDSVLVNWGIPILALMISQIIGRKLNIESQRGEFVREEILGSEKVFGHWSFVLRWVVPAVILIALFLQGLGLVLAQ